MREFDLNEFDKKVRERRPQVFKTILANADLNRRRNRTREADEIKVLNLITVSRWQKALQQGKIKQIDQNTFEYFFD